MQEPALSINRKVSFDRLMARHGLCMLVAALDARPAAVHLHIIWSNMCGQAAHDNTSSSQNVSLLVA